MAIPRLHLTPQQQQWFAENTRVQNGQLYQRRPDGSWVPATGPVSLPGPGQSFGAPGRSGVNVNVPLFGGGAERGGLPGGGATGPGGATFRPSGPAPPIPGSGAGLGASFTPPPSPDAPPEPPAAPPPPTPATASTPTPTTTPAATTGGGTVDAILKALGKYGPLIGAAGSLAANMRTGRQQGRTAEGNAANQSNVTDIARFNAEGGNAQLDLLQRAYLGNDYQRQVGNAVRGGYFQGVEDINIPRPEGVSSRNITGGLRPSAFQGRDQIGAAMQREAMTELLDPTRVASDPRPGTRRLPALPTLPDKLTVPGPTGTDAALDALSYGAAATPLLEALIKALQPAPPTPTSADLPITPPDPLVVTMPNIDIGQIPVTDPYASNRTQGLIDTLGRRRTGAGGYFADPRF